MSGPNVEALRMKLSGRMGPEMQKLREKIAIAPLLAAGAMAAGRAALPMIGRALANPIVNIAAQTGAGMAASKMMQPKPLPGQIGG